MRIESAAGEFEFDIEALKVVGSDVIFTGKMGVWEAETVMEANDMVKMMRLTFGSIKFWGLLIKLPFYALFGKTEKKAETTYE